jgi:hypothetical protein
VRRFHSKCELLDTSGQHLRYVTAAVAEAMVDAEHAIVHNQNGKVRSIKLVECAATAATRIGGPTPLCGPSGVRFVKRERLDTGDVVWQFHRRSFER